MRSQLAEAFEESLQVAPDHADVLVGIRGGIERQRRRRQLYRTIAVVQAVALVLVATAVTTIALRKGNSPAPANPPISVGEWTSTLQLGWVPDGWSLISMRNTTVEEAISYRSKDAEFLSVTVAKVDLPPRGDLAEWERTDINGRPAWAHHPHPYSTDIVWQLPSGRWAEVRVDGRYPNPANPQFQAPQSAKRAAESLEESGNTRVAPGFEPTYLPAGQQVVGVDVEFAEPGHGVVRCASGSPQSVPKDSSGGLVSRGLPMYPEPTLTVSVSTNMPVKKEQSARLPDIQGRPAYHGLEFSAVAVEDFHGGYLLVRGWPELPLAELVKIAEGVRWVG